ncbi:MAG TPA: sigma-54 dependent transcriptional regulator [Candidatus Polarisedimenticolia bacterium]|jgi:two-component system nitrogen regulation response regulator NtrX|nr:sigma-54 dependent transcriptional regulator [Candidatus Polarisedimenticolia bacterium]
MKPRILVIDDEEDIRKSLRMILEYEGYLCSVAASPQEGLELARKEEPDVILLDIKMPQMDGIEVLSRLKEREESAEIVMISGHGTVATAVEATKKGAFDFLEKPLEEGRVLTSIRNALQHRRLSEENRSLKAEKGSRYELVGDSPAIQKVRASVGKIAPTNATVLLTGESGTGKELVAWEIYRLSQRRDRPFVKVNCAAIPEELIESELFGHEKGAFTGAVARQTGKFVQADGGTIFLDEVADMSPRTQAKVLRVLQDGEVEPVGMPKTLHVDVRVLAATNKILEAEIREGRFREDLYFRINTLLIAVPPLRERKGDIPLLIEHFTRRFCSENNRRPKRFSAEALRELASLPWRGNVRELKGAVERLLILADEDEITLSDLAAIRSPITAGPAPSLSQFRTLQEFKEATERQFLQDKLKENDWNISATAKAIDTPRSNLYKKLEQYGLEKHGRDAAPPPRPEGGSGE